MRRILSSLTVLVIGLSVHAQFYTIENKHVKKTQKFRIRSKKTFNRLKSILNCQSTKI